MRGSKLYFLSVTSKRTTLSLKEHGVMEKKKDTEKDFGLHFRSSINLYFFVSIFSSIYQL